MSNIYQNFKSLLNEKPLASAIFIGLFFRLLAAFFSKGYGMHDDHFVIIEIAQGFVDGLDIGKNLPVEGEADVSFGSLFYTGLHYLFFKFLQYIGIFDPQFKMLIVRIVHAFYSLLTIYFGYKITRHISTNEVANKVAFTLAIMWIMPVLAVRNLVETFCIPMLLGGSYLVLKGTEQNKKFYLFFIAGVLWGFAFSIRFQTFFFTGGAGLVLLFQAKWKETIYLALGMFVPILIIHGIIEGPLIGGVFFIKIINYVQYNIINQNNFNPQPWYNYILLVFGIILPPASVFLLPAVFINWKKNILLLIPLFIFFIFHSYFPNKQERFILPVVPYIIILGMVGLDAWKKKEKYKRLISNTFKFAYILNFILLMTTVTMYSKRSRVESMYFLYNKEKLNEIVVENLEYEDGFQLPLYYCGQWPHITYLTKRDDSLFVENRLKQLSSESLPDYFFFVNSKNLKQRVENIKMKFPHIKFERRIEPSFMDIVFQKLNPINKNEEIFIYKNMKG